MGRFREVPCKYYIAFGSCEKGREASHRKYCQHCSKYEPRVRIRSVNRKKLYNEQLRKKGY